ncbi:TetR/AcrR family transcriptional regulator [Rhizobium leguminosarum]|uniref:TetR/AcrR family transcriptional regulator n=1 Tax=Rhizobium leguminosarum TaxID=384 RepID=UPI00144204D7|nr:TetR/AcrR family transcriptional regulator [Rhizobium leguminosarum]NKL08984.1 TetR family transcriptional regulator [Rhizobium leguminosarum bv. viciae]NKL86419.1 TetR family transcriptional regulator [Rhizobium leguminosarum bv. viciae]NKL94686.1 TetR family transcriptional regulator [Rhizobium leguminosarum bv. viciae]NKM95060.1 TetR family transcriptional regulator [Rhizobium leguminosarum bv. viciae]
MSRPTKHTPERGDARTRLLEAAREIIRAKGFAAASVDDLCKAAAVTKGAFFHSFGSKEALGVAAAEFWARTTSDFFAAAPYHHPPDALDRVLAYVAFRKAIITDDLAESSCLVGTMVQETYMTFPLIRDACGTSIFDHASTLEADIELARRERGIMDDWTAESLARYTQTVIQGGFVLAKAGNNAELARESLAHLERYIRLLFRVAEDKT